MSYQYILFELKDQVAFVTINRPEKLNALNDDLINELFKVFEMIKANSEIRAVIISGAKDTFVAGADIKELAQLNSQTGKAKSLKGQSLFNLIENIGIPVIAAISGFALGGGCELALAATIRFASEDAKIGQPEVNLGIIPGYGGTQRLARLVGKGKALELILSGEPIEAAEAYRIGLVNKVVPKAQLLAEAESFARKFISKAPLAIKAALEAINRGGEMSLQDGLNLEANLFGLLCATEDCREGLNAFLTKRPPQFKGK